MNVPLKGSLKRMRRKKFTPAVIEQIPNLVREGRSSAQIAEQIGCSVGSLRVQCSKLGISLRYPPRKKLTTISQNGHQLRRLAVLLSPSTVDKLKRHGALAHISHSQLVGELIEAIARDNLFRAVLDRD
jgi:hypothetical protein